jgi:hypothetical protein
MRYGPWLPGTPPLTEAEKTLRKEAYRIFTKARRRGEVREPDFCEGCSVEGHLYARHEDYRLPLAVIWLCDQCYANAHVRMVCGKKPNTGLTS